MPSSSRNPSPPPRTSFPTGGPRSSPLRSCLKSSSRFAAASFTPVDGSGLEARRCNPNDATGNRPYRRIVNFSKPLETASPLPKAKTGPAVPEHLLPSRRRSYAAVLLDPPPRSIQTGALPEAAEAPFDTNVQVPDVLQVPASTTVVLGASCLSDATAVGLSVEQCVPDPAPLASPGTATLESAADSVPQPQDMQVYQRQRTKTRIMPTRRSARLAAKATSKLPVESKARRLIVQRLQPWLQPKVKPMEEKVALKDHFSLPLDSSAVQALSSLASLHSAMARIAAHRC